MLQETDHTNGLSSNTASHFTTLSWVTESFIFIGPQMVSHKSGKVQGEHLALKELV